MAQWKDLYRRDSVLEKTVASITKSRATVRVSSLADSQGAVHEPVTNRVLVSPVLLRDRPELVPVLVAVSLGFASIRERSRRWRWAVLGFSLSAALDMVLLYAQWGGCARLLDAGLATGCFWGALWQVLALRRYAPQLECLAHDWARNIVPDFTAQHGAARVYCRWLRRATAYRSWSPS
ncbi:hypothetical protein [Acidithiobacillus caldus]|uniref:Uncharacterized protein n=1 Tax=Acidithiobacillus caldus (strain SM-1) TaxID=990288 RepID=F9ZPW4_ACICS|nr:hypothetical protein [Acidithiobacillus caldus]AEK58507.1 conserved hypothetical protein [Acidithiobacillus caldus SM-1]QER46059.1 hypothetical protein F0726_03013 [Acidithiobacillus caldus]